MIKNEIIKIIKNYNINKKIDIDFIHDKLKQIKIDLTNLSIKSVFKYHVLLLLFFFITIFKHNILIRNILYYNMLYYHMFLKIYNDENVFKNISNLSLNQNANLQYVVDELQKKSIDLKTITLGTLSRATYTDYAVFKNITFDDIFFSIIAIITVILIILQNYKLLDKTKYKLSKNTRKNIKNVHSNINCILGFVYVLYGLYMIKMLVFEKNNILVSRYMYVYTYLLAGLTIIIGFFNINI